MSFWDAVQRSLYGPILARLDTMSKALDDMTAKVGELETAVATSNEKQDQLIAFVGVLRQEIQDLKDTGGATPAQLMELTDRLDRTLISITTQTGETDAADETPPA